MATKIVTKNSSTASAAPTASDLVQGELAVNVTDKRLYTENNAGAIVELGTNPASAVTMASTLAVTGNVDFNGDLDVDGTTNLDVVDIDGAVDMASTLAVTGVATLASLVATTADINGGTIDGTVIGGATAAAISGTTGTFSGNLDVGADNGLGGKLSIQTSSYGVLQDMRTLVAGSINPYLTISSSADGITFEQNGSQYRSLMFKTGATERMRIDSSGNVGIGCVPQGNLDIDVAVNTSLGLRSQTGVIVAQYTGAPAVGNRAQIGLGYGNTYTNVSIGAVRTSATAYGTDDFIIATKSGTADTAPTERMRIDSSGNVLVGTTSAYNYSGIAPLLTIDNHAGIGIRNVGSADAGYSTIPSGNHNYYAGYFLNSSGSGVGNISCTSSSTAYNTSSDQRLKENIADADDAGSKIDAIQVRKYDWKADGSHQDYGIIAQELQAVAPEAVSVPEDSEEMMGVDYSKLVPMLIKEIQSLRQRVALLEE